MGAPLRDSNRGVSIAEYLADREDLSGTARENYVRLLKETFGFRPETPRRVAPAIGCLAITVALFGIFLEWHRGWSALVPLLWLGVAELGLIVAAEVARAERAIQATNMEFQWRVYCLLFRPVILSKRPGLIKRSITYDQGDQERVITTAGDAMLKMLRERRINLWVPAALGWGVGSAILVVLRIGTGSVVWPFGMALLGMTMVPPFWCLVRLAIFRGVEKTAREHR